MIIEDREHIVRVFKHEMPRLIEWLQNPNGALIIGSRLVIERVEDGGVLVRTQPYKMKSETT